MLSWRDAGVLKQRVREDKPNIAHVYLKVSYMKDLPKILSII